MHHPRLVNVVHRVVDVKLARRRDDARIVDPSYFLKRLIIIDNDLTLAVFLPPHAYPYLVPGLIELEMDGAPFVRNLPAFRILVRIRLLEDADLLLNGRITIQGVIHPDMFTLRVRFNKQAAAAKGLDLPHLFPGILLVLGRIGAVDSDLALTKMRGAI